MHLLHHPDTSFTCRLKLQEALKKLAVVHSLFYVFRITLKDEAYTKYNLLQRINIMGLKKAKNPNLIQISYKQICAVVTQNKDKFKTCCSPTQLKKRRLLFQCPSGVPESRHLHTACIPSLLVSRCFWHVKHAQTFIFLQQLVLGANLFPQRGQLLLLLQRTAVYPRHVGDLLSSLLDLCL